MLELGPEIRTCAEAQHVHAGFAERLIEMSEPSLASGCIGLPHYRARGVDLESVTRFDVLQREQTGCRQERFPRIVQVQADEVVPHIGLPDFLKDVAPVPL